MSETFKLYPGEGMPYDIEYDADDTSTWAVVASLIANHSGAELSPAPTTEQLELNVWRANVTKDHTLALRGLRATLRIVATDPDHPSMPDVEEAELIISPV